jgi:DNA-directed RNA polymerase subunit RPC12/RpoP
VYDNSETEYKCDGCGTLYSSRDQLKKHQATTARCKGHSYTTDFFNDEELKTELATCIATIKEKIAADYQLADTNTRWHHDMYWAVSVKC